MFLVKIKENKQVVSKFSKIEQAQNFLEKYYTVMTKRYPCRLGENALKIDINGNTKTYIIQKAN